MSCELAFLFLPGKQVQKRRTNVKEAKLLGLENGEGRIGTQTCINNNKNSINMWGGMNYTNSFSKCFQIHK